MTKILLVDDNAAIRSVLERELVRSGYLVTTAADGAKALRLLEESTFDLVITDLVMPDVEGLQILRVLRKQAAPPKVIAMSGGGRSATDYLEMAKLFGAAETLEKPFGAKELTEAVKRVLGE